MRDLLVNCIVWETGFRTAQFGFFIAQSRFCATQNLDCEGKNPIFSEIYREAAASDAFHTAFKADVRESLLRSVAY